jgi:hypothetical protein
MNALFAPVNFEEAADLLRLWASMAALTQDADRRDNDEDYSPIGTTFICAVQYIRFFVLILNMRSASGFLCSAKSIWR